MTGQLSPLAQGKAAGTTGYTSKLLKTGQTTQYDSELDDGYYQVGVAKSYTVNTSGAQSGTTNVDLTHLVSDTGAFTASDKTYTDAGKCNVFKAAGGETIVISGSGSNNGVFTTASATANTVVFVEAITDEADAPMTTFKKREAISNNTVLDNNTGLTWLRYFSVKMGPAGDGYMPWSGKDYDIFQFCAACNAVSVGGYTDWRVANIFETVSLSNASLGHWYPDGTAFPTYGSSGNAWTSTFQYNDSRTYFRRWYVGTIQTGAASPSNAYSVFLVRGGTA